MFLNIRKKTPLPECPFHKCSCSMQLKPIFIQKEVLALVFSSYLKFLTMTFLKSIVIRKRELL